MSGQLNLFDDTGGKPNSSPIGEQILEPILLDKDRSRLPADLVPPDYIFRFTKNYDISGNFLGRLLKAFDENEKAEIKKTREEIAEQLTIPSERIEGLINFSRKTELATAKKQLTPFGRLVLNRDPYLLNVGLLWFIHYFISSNAKVVIWSRLFNNAIYQAEEISPSDISTFFEDVKSGMTDKQFQHNGAKELGAILRTYSDSMLKPLGLFIRIDLGKYAPLSDEFAIPPLIWLAAILTYRDRYYSGAVTLETRLLVDANFSPGRLFRQNEQQVRKVLDRMHSLGLLTVERSLGLDQVRFKSEFTWLGAVAAHLREGK